jgi:hypothetical protein
MPVAAAAVATRHVPEPVLAAQVAAAPVVMVVPVRQEPMVLAAAAAAAATPETVVQAAPASSSSGIINLFSTGSLSTDGQYSGHCKNYHLFIHQCGLSDSAGVHLIIDSGRLWYSW